MNRRTCDPDGCDPKGSNHGDDLLQTGTAADLDGREPAGEPADTEEAVRPPLPWSIKLLGLAFAVYLILRIAQLLGWIVKWIAGG